MPAAAWSSVRLAAGERIDVDTGCVVGYHATVNMDVQRVAGLKSMFFGGEGVFLATLTGPGRSAAVAAVRAWRAHAGRRPGTAARGEGSVLAASRILDGDNSFWRLHAACTRGTATLAARIAGLRPCPSPASTPAGDLPSVTCSWWAQAWRPHRRHLPGAGSAAIAGGGCGRSRALDPLGH